MNGDNIQMVCISPARTDLKMIGSYLSKADSLASENKLSSRDFVQILQSLTRNEASVWAKNNGFERNTRFLYILPHIHVTVGLTSLVELRTLDINRSVFVQRETVPNQKVWLWPFRLDSKFFVAIGYQWYSDCSINHFGAYKPPGRVHVQCSIYSGSSEFDVASASPMFPLCGPLFLLAQFAWNQQNAV